MKYINLKYPFLLVIKFYKIFVSPLLPPSCRYYPTCSDYTYQAIEKYGVLRGSIMGIIRIMKCNQFFKGGYDPVK